MNTSKLARGVSSYFKSSDGHIAVVTALIGIPLLLAVSVALDLGNASSKRAKIAAGVDAAALASVIPGDLTDQERADFASVAFYKNYFGNGKVNLNITAVRERVDIVAHIQVPTLLSSIIGKNYLDVRESASAILTQTDVVCLLALDPSGDKAIEFKDGSRFYAPACSVQANSTNHLALNNESTVTPQAKSFCSSGNSRGNFYPLVKNACTPVADPYASLAPPPNGACNGIKKIQGSNSNVPHFAPWDNLDAMYSGSVTTVWPGTFCEGLEIQEANVKFMPGIYIVDGAELKISSKSAISGDGVTIILKGQNAKMFVESDSNVQIIAPSSGTYKGIAFYEAQDQGFGQALKKPNGETLIKSGGGFSIIGTGYFPTQTVEISDSNHVAAQSPATSFIAYRLSFKGDSQTELHVDHETGGIPPQLPRSDVGARLIE